MDVVKASWTDSDNEQVFLVMAGMGYDAAIMADTNEDLKDKHGLAGLRGSGHPQAAWQTGEGPRRIDGRHPVHRRVRSVMVGNCGQIKGGVEIFPDAKVDDGVLDLLVLAPTGRLGWLSVVAGIIGRDKDETIRGVLPGKNRRDHPGARQEITSSTATMGDTRKHLTIRVDPNALTSVMNAPPRDYREPAQQTLRFDGGPTAVHSREWAAVGSCLGC